MVNTSHRRTVALDSYPSDTLGTTFRHSVEVAMLSSSHSRQSHLRLVHSAEVSFTNGVDVPRRKPNTDRQRFRVIEGGRGCFPDTHEQARLAAERVREIG
jgi:hypothetical protein